MEDGNLMNKLNIIYEDNHLLVVEKPINIPVLIAQEYFMLFIYFHRLSSRNQHV